MKFGKIKFNARIRPRPILEIRYVKPNFKGSNVLLGLAANLYGVYLCIYPFIFSITMSRRIKPSPLTKEELEDLKNEE